MIEIRIMSIENPQADRCAGPWSHKHSKFVIRRKYVEEILLPQMSGLVMAKIFNAVVPEQLKLSTENGLTYATLCDIKIRVREGIFANFASHFLLWQECISLNKCVLILEDDAYLPTQNVAVVSDSLQKYEMEHFSENSLLYLQSQIPSTPHLHTYTSEPSKNLLKLIHTGDLSGTAAYCVNPTVAKTLIKIALREDLRAGFYQATDGFVHSCQYDKFLDVLLPKDNSHCFMLHDHFGKWQLQHDPNICDKTINFNTEHKVIIK